MRNEYAELAELCLAHLVREEHGLRANRDGLTRLHGAFTRGTMAELQAALADCQHLAGETLTLKNTRQQICQRFAEAMDIEPSEVHLSGLIAWLPSPYSERIAACKDKLQSLTSEVERLTKRVASLANYCKAFLQKSLEDAPGQDAIPVQYGPAHRRVETRGSLLIANG